MDIYARVIWKSGDLYGLKFDSRIRPWDIERLRTEARKGIDAKMSAAEKGGADDWSGGVAR